MTCHEQCFPETVHAQYKPGLTHWPC